ncbi:MAG: replication initiator protein [Microviridae sp.]|nr:MAG: replication initiator protein [Microviridae sp.]
MCINPIYLEKTGKTFSCGKCKQCHQRYTAHWVFRLQQEQRITNKSVFLTLTYDYEHIPMNKGKFTLFKKDYQDFLKRLRKQISNKIKYVVCGEYGGQNNRPHYHLILFGVDKDDFNIINQAWGKGLIHLGNVQPNSIAYVFKYSIKGDKKTRDWRQTKQFVAMSKGLGENFAFDIQYQKTQHINKHGQTITRQSKIRTPLPHFDKKLKQLILQPYYTIPSQDGGTVKMSMPRFYLKASNYDTTELTETFLDKMASKYQDVPPLQLVKILEIETIQRAEAYKKQEKDVLYSISKEKI